MSPTTFIRFQSLVGLIEVGLGDVNEADYCFRVERGGRCIVDEGG